MRQLHSPHPRRAQPRLAQPRLAQPARACPGPVCSIVPPYLLLSIAENGTPQQRAVAVRALTESAAIRARRATLNHLTASLAAPSGVRSEAAGQQLAVYDVAHGGDSDLPGTLVRGQDDPASADDSVNEAFDGSNTTRGFYQAVFGRDSVDGQGLELISSVHYSNDYDNAFWNGSQMVYGDGSGQIFEVGGLTKDIAVIAHELTHGVTQYTAGLTYSGQSGALNESMSDVFGSLVKQYSLGQDAASADWLIGAGVLGSALQGDALRSMKAPGTAYNGDPQPADMDGYVDLPIDDDPRHDHGGVHINSGIPNHAFFLLATSLGGNAWETAGQIWYDTLTQSLTSDADFAAAADATVAAAGSRYGDGSTEQQAVQDAWKQVKVLS